MDKRIVKNTSVLVTGGAGFIGSNLCEALLNQNNEVVCLDNFATGKRENVSSFLTNPKFKLIEGDICNYEDCVNAITGVEHVLHQAALGSVPRSIENPIRTNETNITGFLNMLTACKEAGIKRFVYAASSSTYGDHPTLPKVEDNIGKPLSPYAVTKYVNELYANVFSDLYGIEVIGLRYFNVFGPRQDPEGAYAAVIPKFVAALIKKESPVIHGDGEQSRDFTFIDNVIQANQLAVLSDSEIAANQVYNIAFGGRTSVNQLFFKLRELLSVKDASIGKVEPEYGEQRRGDVKNSLASIDKAKERMSYNPDIDVENGLALSIEWYWNCFKELQSSVTS